MATITLRGTPIHTSGELPKVGTKAPDFVLTNGELKDVSLKDFAGMKKVLNIVPSLDTPVCAISTRKFNQQAGALPKSSCWSSPTTCPSPRSASAPPRA